MKQIQLPKDIRKYVRNKILFRLLEFLILIAASAFLNILLYEEFIQKTHISVYMVFLLITVILPFWITRVPFHFFDRSWCGTVKAIDIQEETGTYTVGSRPWPYTKHSIILTVETTNGKLIKTKVKEYGIKSHKGFAVPSEGNIQLHMNNYSEGNMVYHFYGLTELFVISQNKSTNVSCVVCGSQNPMKSSQCHYCGHSLLHTLFDGTESSGEGASS